jgi:hypothetical protein
VIPKNPLAFRALRSARSSISLPSRILRTLAVICFRLFILDAVKAKRVRTLSGEFECRSIGEGNSSKQKVVFHFRDLSTGLDPPTEVDVGLNGVRIRTARVTVLPANQRCPDRISHLLRSVSNPNSNDDRPPQIVLRSHAQTHK